MARTERGPADEIPSTASEARPEDARTPPGRPDERGGGERRAEEIARSAAERTPGGQDRDTSSYDAPERPTPGGTTGER